MSTMQSRDKQWIPQGMSLAAVNRLLLTTLFTALCLTHQTTSGAASVQTVSGTLHAENFTYYKLSGEGWLRLELHSLQGDVDLYVSGTTLHPTFSEYELKSDSCGVDTVDIHSSMNRPVGIGIYAHPFYIQSAFRMDILVVKENEEDEYEQLFQSFHSYEYEDGDEELKGDSKKRGDRKSGLLHGPDEEEEESIWWTIVVTILKFILEVIV